MKKILYLLLISVFQNMCGQDYALKVLNDSPRHHEWVKVESQDGKKVHAFLAYPENSKKTTAVIVLHENRGLTDWVRSFADQLAAEGYLAIAPDLLSGYSEEYDKTSDFSSSDDARQAIYELNAENVTNDLNAVYEYISKVEACNGKVVVAGFCWGGSQSFRYATNNPNIKASMVFYGSAPESNDEIARIKAPVYGFYGGDDARINAGIENTEKMMKENGKKYVYEIYEGAGHAYMRRGDDPNGEKANVDARNASWIRIKKLLKDI